MSTTSCILGGRSWKSRPSAPRDLAGKRQNGEPVDQHVAGVLVFDEGDDTGGDLDEVRAEFTPISNVEDLGQPVRGSHRAAAEEVVRLGDELHDPIVDPICKTKKRPLRTPFFPA